jgi:hypothetical protein
MLFSALYGKPIAQLNLNDELVPFLVEHAFMGFMDSGRQGLQRSALDVIDNMAFHMKENSTDPKVKKFLMHRLPEDQYRKLESILLRNMIDGFIREGSSGLHTAVVGISHTLLSVMQGEELK